MNAIQAAAAPYYYPIGAMPAELEQAPSAPQGSISFLAILAGLLLLTAQPPEAGVVPTTEIAPLNDTRGDLTLAEIAGHFERHWGKVRRHESYRFGQLVLELSERHQLAPSLILAVIEKESSFRPAVVSKAGAVGLMQLLPATAKEVAKAYRIRSYKSEKDLTNPAVNLRLGVAYLSYLRHQFGHSLHYLAAYNLGPTALRKRLRDGNYELGALDRYVRSIHERSRELAAGRSLKLHSLLREEALLAASF